jgi:hypothetical protein
VTLWVAERTGTEFEQASFDALQNAFESLPISIATDKGFCLQLDLGCGPCFSWYGRPLPRPIQPFLDVRLQLWQRELRRMVASDQTVQRESWESGHQGSDEPGGIQFTPDRFPTRQPVMVQGKLDFSGV